jgi:hypothetical protein
MEFTLGTSEHATSPAATDSAFRKATTFDLAKPSLEKKASRSGVSPAKSLGLIVDRLTRCVPLVDKLVKAQSVAEVGYAQRPYTSPARNGNGTGGTATLKPTASAGPSVPTDDSVAEIAAIADDLDQIFQRLRRLTDAKVGVGPVGTLNAQGFSTAGK